MLRDEDVEDKCTKQMLMMRKWRKKAQFIANVQEERIEWEDGHLSTQMHNLTQYSLGYPWHIWHNMQNVRFYDAWKSTCLKVKENL